MCANKLSSGNEDITHLDSEFILVEQSRFPKDRWSWIRKFFCQHCSILVLCISSSGRRGETSVKTSLIYHESEWKMMHFSTVTQPFPLVSKFCCCRRRRVQYAIILAPTFIDLLLSCSLSNIELSNREGHYETSKIRFIRKSILRWKCRVEIWFGYLYDLIAQF